jgi:hypothetical protein
VSAGEDDAAHEAEPTLPPRVDPSEAREYPRSTKPQDRNPVAPARAPAYRQEDRPSRIFRRSRRILGREPTDATQTPSLDELIAAFQATGRPNYDELRKRFQKENGRLRDTYFARNIHAGAVIVEPKGLGARVTQLRRIRIRYDGLDAVNVQPEFEAAIWRCRAMERQSGLILGGRSRKVLVEMLFAILVYLLGVLDATGSPAHQRRDPLPASERRKRVDAALKSAGTELNRLDAFTRDAARKASLRWYLLGLPLGAIGGIILIEAADAMSIVGAPPEVVRVCFASGAVGAIVSVMTRITRGQRLVIDSEQGHLVTLLAGGFRPLIGAVFGLALYVFVQGGLVPIAVPPDPSKERLFFAALAFLAGFSERWAQDTIVKSAPIVGRPAADPPKETR